MFTRSQQLGRPWRAYCRREDRSMAEAADSGHNLSDSINAGRGELLKILLRHEVKFVVIGGAAIQSHGRRYVTEDIDLAPDTEEANL